MLSERFQHQMDQSLVSVTQLARENPHHLAIVGLFDYLLNDRMQADPDHLYDTLASDINSIDALETTRYRQESHACDCAYSSCRRCHIEENYVCGEELWTKWVALCETDHIEFSSQRESVIHLLALMISLKPGLLKFFRQRNENIATGQLAIVNIVLPDVDINSELHNHFKGLALEEQTSLLEAGEKCLTIYEHWAATQ